jgi:hypothetical protein
VFFEVNRGGRYTRIPTPKAVCIGCLQTERDNLKRYNRPKAKARNTFYRHADKFIKEGLAGSREDFAQRFDWSVKQMAHDIEHTYKNGCPYCRQFFSEMGHGLSDLTLDIIDPEKPPYYTTNVKWVCSTCNKEKQRTPPEYWGPSWLLGASGAKFKL